MVESHFRKARGFKLISRFRMYPLGSDVIWLSADCESNVAAFVTGGAGPIPKLFASDLDKFELVEDMIAGLLPTGEAEMLTSVKRPEDFISMSQRGIYVYDWCDVYRSDVKRTNAYEIVSRPTAPIKLDSIPHQYLHLVDRRSANKILFSDVGQILFFTDRDDFIFP